MQSASEMLESALGNTYRIRLENDPMLDDAIGAAIGDSALDFGLLWDTIGRGRVTPQGKIAKRIASYLFKVHGIKLSDDVIQRIGESVSRGMTGEYDATLICREADLWRPGKYGDDGSDYFWRKSGAIPAIFEHGGAGVAVHSATGDPIGRAWIVCPQGDCPYLALWNWFNVRGLNWGMSSLAQLLTQGENSPFRGMEFCPQAWTNREYHGVYIMPNGYALCEVDKLTDDSGHIDLGIKGEDRE